MKKITNLLGGIALSCCMASGVAQAANIQSMTIEEIGVASGDFDMSAIQSVGGEASAYDPSGAYFGGSGFVSAGSADGAIIMGTVQGNNAFTLGFTAAGSPGELNTLRGAPSGSITDGIMTLDLSGLVAEYGGYSFSISPLNFDPVTNTTATNFRTAVSMIDANHYYYTADWSHRVANGEVFSLATGAPTTAFTGWFLYAHLEGIATMAPVPEADTYAMMLAGLGLVGLMAHRRRMSV